MLVGLEADRLVRPTGVDTCGIDEAEASRTAVGISFVVMSLEDWSGESLVKEVGEDCDSELLERWNAEALKLADKFRRRPILTTFPALL